jgi:hypothetical protein
MKTHRYSDGGLWYPEACKSLELTKTKKHNILHLSFEKRIIERAIE